MHSLGREYFYRVLSISRRETTVLWVKLVFVVSAVAISYCIIIIAHLHGLYCAFGQALLHLCSPQWVSDVITLPWRKRGSLFRPSYAYDKRFVLHVAYIYLRVINVPYVGETRILYTYIHTSRYRLLFIFHYFASGQVATVSYWVHIWWFQNIHFFESYVRLNIFFFFRTLPLAFDTIVKHSRNSLLKFVPLIDGIVYIYIIQILYFFHE